MRIRVPVATQSIALADWLEVFMCLGQRSRVSRSKIRGLLRGILLVDGDSLQVAIELLFLELTRRQQVIGDHYPFVVQDAHVSLTVVDNSLPYIFMLCLCMSEPLRTEGRQSEVETLLDMLVLDALSGYLSGSSRGVHFGWPTSGDRPPAFPAAIAWLAERLGLAVGKGQKRSARRDGGVDVVVWRPFNDRREGFVTILAQCTIAVDWSEKAKDIVVDLWRGYIDFGKDPITCLAIPYVIPHPFDKWDELRRTVHFVLDRLRICEILDGVDLSHRQRISEWTEAEMRVMNAA